MTRLAFAKKLMLRTGSEGVYYTAKRAIEETDILYTKYGGRILLGSTLLWIGIVIGFGAGLVAVSVFG